MMMFSVSTAAEDFARPGLTVEDFVGCGVHLKLDNGWTISVQWGPGTYSSNHGDMSFDAWKRPAKDSLTAEIAAWKDEGEMIPWPEGDTVRGWQSWDEVQAVIDAAERDELPLAEALA